MNNASAYSFALALLPLALPVRAGEPALHIDPFARPVLERPAPPPAPAAKPAAPPPAPWAPTLRATVVAGRHSLVDVDGVVVGIGQEIAGYRLVQVGERRAVFEKHGTRRVLEIP